MQADIACARSHPRESSRSSKQFLDELDFSRRDGESRHFWRGLNFGEGQEQNGRPHHNISLRLAGLRQQVRLTAHGQRLLPYAERILRLVEEAGVIAAGSEKPAGTLVVGSPESVLTYRLPRILKAFWAKFPDVKLVFRAVNSAELVPQLERAELDLGLVIDDGLDDSRFRVETLCAEPLSLLASSRHPLFALRRDFQNGE